MWPLSQSTLRSLCRPHSSNSQLFRYLQNNISNGSSSRTPTGRLRTYRIRPKQRAGAGSRSVEGINPSEAVEVHVPQVERSAFQLWKPTLFTFGFTGTCFVGAAIWEYEHKRRQADFLFNPKRWTFEQQRQKAGELRRQISSWWNNRTRGEKVFYTILSLNGLVYLAWNIPALRRTMIRYFTSSFYGEKLCLPMVLSSFSHYSLIHLSLNMYVLWSFGGRLIDHMMGAEQYVGFYLTAGVVASLAGFFHRALFRLPTYALGASGAILGVLTYTCTKLPDAQLSIIFLPMFTFPAQSALYGIIAFDAIGLLLRWRLFDHAAHLGGSLLGIWYGYYGEQLIWSKRYIIVEKWKALTGR